jgi:hypothetical protein
MAMVASTEVFTHLNLALILMHPYLSGSSEPRSYPPRPRIYHAEQHIFERQSRPLHLGC